LKEKNMNPKKPRLPRTYTPRTVLFVAILGGVVGICGALVVVTSLIKPLSGPHAGEYYVAAAGVGALMLLTIVGAAFCFALAREGYRQGYVRSLSYREQIALACLVTVFMTFAIWCSVQTRHWLFLPLFLPNLILAWSRVVRNRPRERASAADEKAPK